MCEQGGKQKIQHKQRNRLYLRADREWSLLLFRWFSSSIETPTPKATVPCFPNNECRQTEDRLITFGLNHQLKGLAREHRRFHLQHFGLIRLLRGLDVGGTIRAISLCEVAKIDAQNKDRVLTQPSRSYKKEAESGWIRWKHRCVEPLKPADGVFHWPTVV